MKIANSTPLLTGFLIAVMVTINTSLSVNIGESYSVFIIHLTGLIILLLAAFLLKQKVRYKNSIPFWLYLGGGLGIFIVLFNNLTIQNIGVSLALSLGIAGQIITSVVLEHIGFLGTIQKKFNPSMLPGVILVLAGSIIIIV